ncbi:hypothetical protein HRG_012638 [Hirsutella rhossiliensis]
MGIRHCENMSGATVLELAKGDVGIDHLLEKKSLRMVLIEALDEGIQHHHESRYFFDGALSWSRAQERAAPSSQTYRQKSDVFCFGFLRQGLQTRFLFHPGVTGPTIRSYMSDTTSGACSISKSFNTSQVAIPAREQPIDSTARPTFDPEPERGPEFTPFHVPEREPQPRQLPPTPLLLFQQFLAESLVESWVGYTNNGPRPGPEGPKQQHSRENSWTETSLGYTAEYASAEGSQ